MTLSRLAVIATILVAAAACDKKTAGSAPAPGGFDLAKRPEVLFQLFGDRSDPRMLPVLYFDGPSLKQLELPAAEWRVFDSLYTRPGNKYTLYADGAPAGIVRVRQGMWETGEPLYTLPGCQSLLPHAAVTVAGGARDAQGEYFATSRTIAPPIATDPMAPAEVAREARRGAQVVGASASLSTAKLGSLDFRAVALSTGATSSQTIIGTFIDPGGGPGMGDREGNGNTAHVFAILDRIGTEYVPTFRLSVNGPQRTAEFRRYVDHLDLTGDGVSEIVLEGWQFGADSYLIILGFADGAWTEKFRGRSSWCLDQR